MLWGKSRTILEKWPKRDLIVLAKTKAFNTYLSALPREKRDKILLSGDELVPQWYQAIISAECIVPDSNQLQDPNARFTLKNTFNQPYLHFLLK